MKILQKAVMNKENQIKPPSYPGDPSLLLFKLLMFSFSEGVIFVELANEEAAGFIMQGVENRSGVLTILDIFSNDSESGSVLLGGDE